MAKTTKLSEPQSKMLGYLRRSARWSEHATVGNLVHMYGARANGDIIDDWYSVDILKELLLLGCVECDASQRIQEEGAIYEGTRQRHEVTVKYWKVL